jgi:hypothetical protein
MPLPTTSFDENVLGSALLFPGLCAPTGDPPGVGPITPDLCCDRTAMMPRRTTTRAQNRAHRSAAERRDNRQAPREIRVTANDEPPSF